MTSQDLRLTRAASPKSAAGVARARSDRRRPAADPLAPDGQGSKRGDSPLGDDSLRSAIGRLVERKDLLRPEMEALLEDIFAGRGTPAQVGALLVGLRLKGETSEELVGAAEALRRHGLALSGSLGRRVLDTCGTGGDGNGTFNISTAVAFVAAAGGATVAKHVNVGSTSRAGSAEVLAALGVRIDVPVAVTERCLAEEGLAFLFAPRFHPVMGEVAVLRRELGVRTLFNLLSPLTNPAGARCQLVGVYDGALVHSMAHALLALGTERSLVVHGEDGLDEISPSGPTTAALVDRGVVWPMILTPEDVGLPRVRVEDLRGGDAAENAHTLRALLRGAPGSVRSAVLLNASAALWIAGLAPDLRSGATQAADLLDSGRAFEKLERVVALSQTE